MRVIYPAAYLITPLLFDNIMVAKGFKMIITTIQHIYSFEKIATFARN